MTKWALRCYLCNEAVKFRQAYLHTIFGRSEEGGPREQLAVMLVHEECVRAAAHPEYDLDSAFREFG